MKSQKTFSTSQGERANPIVLISNLKNSCKNCILHIHSFFILWSRIKDGLSLFLLWNYSPYLTMSPLNITTIDQQHTFKQIIQFIVNGQRIYTWKAMKNLLIYIFFFLSLSLPIDIYIQHRFAIGNFDNIRLQWHSFYGIWVFILFVQEVTGQSMKAFF